MPDESIDYSDIPPVTSFEGWERGKFYRPDAFVREPEAVTVHLDASTLAWFRRRGGEASLDDTLAKALRDYVAMAAE